MDRVMKDDVVGGLESLDPFDYGTKVTIELRRASDRVVA